MHLFLFLTISYQFERDRTIGMRGLSYRAVAHRVGQNVATVLRCCRAWFEDRCY
jgi:transposase